MPGAATIGGQNFPVTAPVSVHDVLSKEKFGRNQRFSLDACRNLRASTSRRARQMTTVRFRTNDAAVIEVV